ncbi:sigma factor [Bradyrhizobium sp.]|uniref:sigma factor n=1 Tax=Bradyrhizobium sp. TaxID=376 RepID=UPI002393904B|nr:sigma factor [Bradyrhizobium sp.]MDE1933529.1 hypothetical protein [Bradyrhizobium sp.]
MARHSGSRIPVLRRVAVRSTQPIASNPGWDTLMARAGEGDRAAYRRLLQEITPYLRFLAARRYRDLCDIEGAVQDALLTVHSIRQTCEPARSFAPWLVAIANRRFIDRLRRQRGTSYREAALAAQHWPQGKIEDRPEVEGIVNEPTASN